MKSLSNNDAKNSDDINDEEEMSSIIVDDEKKSRTSSRSLLLISDNCEGSEENVRLREDVNDEEEEEEEETKWNVNPIYEGSEEKSSTTESVIEDSLDSYEPIVTVDDDDWDESLCKDKVVSLMEDGNLKLNGGDSGCTKNRSEGKQRKRCCRRCCGPKLQFFFGGILLLLGILSCLFSFQDVFLNERLKMMPGLPAFDWWAVPPENVNIYVYLFNITNGDAFLNGIDEDIQIEEVGPIVYREMVKHTNITFNENGTLTYTAHRWPVFLPELNTHIDMNAFIYHPNLPLLGLAAYLQDMSSSFKLIFNIGNRNTPVISKSTIYNILWNSTDPTLKLIKKIAPGFIPTDNVGILHAMYHDFADEVTVYIGPKWGDRRFFTIDKFHGLSTMPGYDPNECPDTFSYATEGMLYSQRLTNKSVIRYWRKTVCRVVDLFYEKDEVVNGILGHRYSLPKTAYHRTKNGTIDCYAGQNLPDGFSDVSKCFANFPIATSLPHYVGVDPKNLPRLKGYKPNPERHTSFAVLEPLTGIPLESRAISQSNLILGKLTGFFKDVRSFSNMILPMFWMEIREEKLPNYVWNLINFSVKYLPICQVIFVVSFILFGVLLISKGCYSKFCKNNTKSFFSQQKLDNFARKKILLENSYSGN